MRKCHARVYQLILHCARFRGGRARAARARVWRRGLFLRLRLRLHGLWARVAAAMMARSELKAVAEIP
eukprot:COSAG01_NODE_3398_length_6144_cov_24.119438_7_plen_67_part_01